MGGTIDAKNASVTKTLAITTASLPSVPAGSAYSAQLAYTGGLPPISWSLHSGTIPAGLGLSSTGLISGTPTAAAAAALVFTATDHGGYAVNSGSITLTVNAAPATLTITTTSPLPAATVGAPYFYQLAATGGTAPYTWTLTAGSLSSGLALSTAGVISGTPVNAEVDAPSIQVTDSLGAPSPIVAFSLTVNAARAGFDYYISTTGNDANLGTLASPWSITAINNNRATYAGKKVGVLPGLYNINCGGSDGNAPALIVAKGSLSSPTIIQSTTPLGAILDGGAGFQQSLNQGIIGSSALSGDNQTANGNGFITIDGFEIRNGGGKYLVYFLVEFAPLTVANPLHGITIQNCFIHGLWRSNLGDNPGCIGLYQTEALIQNNHLSNVSGPDNRGTAIEGWACYGAGCTVQYNTIMGHGSSYNLSGAIFWKNNYNTNHTVRYNYIDFSNTTPGDSAVMWDLYPLGWAPGTDVMTFNNNVCVGGAGFRNGILGAGNSIASMAEAVKVYNNTCTGFIIFGAAGTLTSFNNIFLSTTNSGRGALDVNVSNLSLSDYNAYTSAAGLGVSADGNNDYPGNGGGGGPTASLATWAGLLNSAVIGKDAHSQKLASFGFAGGGTLPGDAYKLGAGSPCIGAGRSNGLPGGSIVDVGAFGGASAPTRVGCNFLPTGW